MILDKIRKTQELSLNSHAVSVAKAISWRIVGTLDTLLISYLVSGKFEIAVSIASVEVVTKIGLFYFHERAWGWIKIK